MKRELSFFAVGALVASLVGCSQSSDNTATGTTNQTAQNVGNDLSNAWQKTRETTTNAWDSVKNSVQSTTDYGYDHKDVYVAKARADLDAVDRKIQEWSDKAANAADSTKAAAQAKLQDLRARRATLEDKYQAVKNSSAANWDDVKTGFENAYDGMTNSVKQAWQWLNDKVSS
jgi:BMFP domain-containing protein YqiC